MTTKLKQTDKANEELLCKVLGLTDPDYKVLRIESMYSYIAAYANSWSNSQGLKEMLISSTTFEKWYTNAFNRRNWAFVHKYCLKSYQSRIKSGRKVRLDKMQLTKVYLKLVRIDPNFLYPDIETMRLITKEHHNE